MGQRRPTEAELAKLLGRGDDILDADGIGTALEDLNNRGLRIRQLIEANLGKDAVVSVIL